MQKTNREKIIMKKMFAHECLCLILYINFISIIAVNRYTMFNVKAIIEDIHVELSWTNARYKK